MRNNKHYDIVCFSSKTLNITKIRGRTFQGLFIAVNIYCSSLFYSLLGSLFNCIGCESLFWKATLFGYDQLRLYRGFVSLRCSLKIIFDVASCFFQINDIFHNLSCLKIDLIVRFYFFFVGNFFLISYTDHTPYEYCLYNYKLTNKTI